MSLPSFPAAAVKPGRHIVLPGANTPMANYWLTLMQQAGVPTDSFGHSTGIFPELLAQSSPIFCHQLSMPTQDCVGSEQAVDLSELFAKKDLAFHGQATSLVVGQGLAGKAYRSAAPILGNRQEKKSLRKPLRTCFISEPSAHASTPELTL